MSAAHATGLQTHLLHIITASVAQEGKAGGAALPLLGDEDAVDVERSLRHGSA